MHSVKSSGASTNRQGGAAQDYSGEDPLIDKIKEVLSHQNTKEQQFVQFYPNQTQYIINLHNHIDGTGRGNDNVQASEVTKRRGNTNQNTGAGRRKARKEGTTTISNDASVNQRKTSLNSQNAKIRTKNQNDAAGPKSVSRRRTNWFTNNNQAQKKVNQDLRGSQYEKLRTQFTIYQSQNNRQSQAQSGDGTAMITSRVKTHRQELFNQNNDNYNQVHGSMRLSQVSPKIRINNQMNHGNAETALMNIGSPRSSVGGVHRRKGSRDQSRKREASISGSNQVRSNERVPLNELLRQTGSDVLTGSMNLGGPKLFINKQASTNEYYEGPKHDNIEFQSSEAMHHQYLEQYPTNNKVLQSFDTIPKDEQLQSSKSSHLEKYKSIPLKNLKKTKGNGVIKYSTHHKQLSNNQPAPAQLSAFGGLQGTQTELGPLQFGALGEPIPGPRTRGLAGEAQDMTAHNDSQNISIINEINQKFKTSRISPGQQMIAPRTRQTNQLQSLQPGGSDSSYFKGGGTNHFRQNKKQSMQQNVTGGRMIPMNTKLVSNHASVSQSQVPRMNGNFSMNQSQPSTINSLKTRYGRSKKSNANNDSASRQVIRSYSRSINNLNQKLSSGNTRPVAYGNGTSVGSSIRQAMHTINHDEQRTRWKEGSKGSQTRNVAISSLSKERMQAISQEEAASIPMNRAYKKSQKIRVSGSINYQTKGHGSQGNNSLSRSRLQMKTQTSQVYPQSSGHQGVSSLYQSHNNQHSNMKKFNTINQASQSNQKRFRTKNQNNPTWDWSSQNAINLESTNSNQKKNLSPICILDNSQENAVVSSGNRTINKTQQQNAIDPEMLKQTQKQYSQMFKKTENLTEQIRKVNKIQIKKRFKESLQPEKTLVKEAQELIKRDMLDGALQKLLEFIKLQPLNVEVHFQIGNLYRQLDREKQNNEYLEEAILHYEQVIKHNEHNKALSIADEPSDAKPDPKQQLSGEALFEIVKIHIHHRDFYQASYELDRAKHFKYDDNAKPEIGAYLKGYHKFVQAVILMMKRKIEPANEILASILQQQKSPNFFKFQILMYRAYGSIILKNYTEAIQDINLANKIKQEHLQTDREAANFDSIGQFNLQLAQMLKSANDKLPKIKQLNANFPKNKDVIRYHAAFLIQRQIEQEMNKHQESQKNAEKDVIIQDLKVIKRVGNSPLKKSQSEAMIQTHSPADDSELDEGDKQRLNLFYQKVATCNVDHPQKHGVIQDALNIIAQGLSFAPRDRHLLLSRSHLQFYQHKFFEALVDIEAVIEIERASSGEEEPNATDLLHKGRCHACLSMFKEAIADFTKVIELDDELYDAYFFRGKCAYLIGETSQAFLDFQKLILIQPKNPMVHAFAGNLLMTTGSYDDATKAFTNADKVHPCAFAIYQRARCYLALGDIKNSMNDLYQACVMYAKNNTNNFKSGDSIANHPNPIALRDKNCLETILNSLDYLNSNSTQIHKPNQKSTKMKRNSKNSRSNDEILLNGSDEGDATVIKSHDSGSSNGEEGNEVLLLNQDLASDPESAKHFEFFTDKFTDLIEIDKIELREILDEQQILGPQRSDQEFLEFKNVTQDSRMQQQIIPNVNRIKIEKVRALLWKQNKQEQIEDARNKNKKATLDPNIYDLSENDTDLELKEQGLKICPWSYYMENLFSKDDIYLYRGVIHFYQGEYKKAIQDFQYSNQVKKLHKLLDNQQTQNSDSDIPSDPERADESLSDEEESESQRQEFRQFLKEKEAGDPNESTNTDLSDIGLCSINRNERIYNILLCYMQLNNVSKAKAQLRKLIERCPAKYTRDILIIEDILYKWGKAKKAAHKGTTEASTKKEPEPTLFVEPFAAAHRLCRFFPCVQFKLRCDPTAPTFTARPSFSFPFVKPPNMIPNVDETLLHSEFGGNRASSYLPQPQALWIKIQHDTQASLDSNQQERKHEKPQPQEHFQFTDNIVQPNESFCSQSQSYLSSALSDSRKRPETE